MRVPPFVHTWRAIQNNPWCGARFSYVLPLVVAGNCLRQVISVPGWVYSNLQNNKPAIEDEEVLMPGASSEDKLLASNQGGSNNGASRSTAVLKPTAGTSDNKAKNGLGVPQYSYPEPIDDGGLRRNKDRQECRPPDASKRQKSTGALLKSQYQKVFHILSKVTKNKDAGIVDKWGEKDLSKYQAILEEYNNKCPRNHQDLTLSDGVEQQNK